MSHASSHLPLYMAYQPVVRLQHQIGVVHAYEALLRVGPNDESVSTYSLITASEQDGTMPLLDSLIAKMVCTEALTHTKIKVWLNISQLSMACPRTSQRIAHIITKHNLNDRITIEITETANGNEDDIRRSLLHFKAHNLTVLLDDVNEGYAKRDLLKSDLVTGCKLSRTSTQRMLGDADYRLQIEHLIRNCHKQGKCVVMEGIETPSELRLAQTMKVDFAQGYYFCPPTAIEHAPKQGIKLDVPHL